MNLKCGEKRQILKKGLFSTGIHRPGSVNRLFQEIIPRSVYIDSRRLLEIIPFCKANILVEVWNDNPEFYSNTELLGISCTTKENLESWAIRPFGKNILEITVPQNSIVTRIGGGYRSDSEKERTILFFVPPEAIKIL